MQQSHQMTLVLEAAEEFAATLTLHAIQSELEPVVEMVTETDTMLVSMTFFGATQ